MMRWADVLPAQTAKSQTAWEYRQCVLRVHEAGWSYAAIGDHLGITKQAVFAVCRKAQREARRPPVQRFFADQSDIWKLSKVVQARPRPQRYKPFNFTLRRNPWQRRAIQALERWRKANDSLDHAVLVSFQALYRSVLRSGGERDRGATEAR